MTEFLNDIEKFFEVATGLTPHDYQRAFLKSDRKRIAVRAGRKTGKTMMVAVKVLYRAFMTPDQEIVIFAPIYDQSKYLFDKIVDMIKKNEFIRKATTKLVEKQIKFDNGSTIYCQTAKSDEHARRFTPHLVVEEEAAWIPEEFDAEVVEPSLAATDGDIIKISTPYGKQGSFYKIFDTKQNKENLTEDEKRYEYKKFHIKCQDAPHILKSWIARRKPGSGYPEEMSESLYLQEIEAEFIEEADNYFTKQEVKDCWITEESKHLDKPRQGVLYKLGVDCARMGSDETVYIVGEFEEGVCKIVDIDFTAKKLTTDIVGRIKALHATFNFDLIYIDATGIGSGPVDQLMEENLPIVPVPMNDYILKGKMYQNLKTLMQHRKIKFYYHEKLIKQMEDLRHEWKTWGLTVHAPSKGHDDFPDALTLLVKDLRITSEDSGSGDFFMA